MNLSAMLTQINENLCALPVKSHSSLFQTHLFHPSAEFVFIFIDVKNKPSTAPCSHYFSSKSSCLYPFIIPRIYLRIGNAFLPCLYQPMLMKCCAIFIDFPFQQIFFSQYS